MDILQQIIQEAECKEAYPFEFDVNQYKADFANLMASLEFANAQTVEEVAYEEPVVVTVKETKKQTTHPTKKVTFASVMRAVFASKQFKYAGSTAAAVMVSVASGIIAVNTIGKGGF